MTELRDHLIALLGRHDPADSVAAAHLVRMRSLVESPGDPFDRDRHQPGHFTAGGFVCDGNRLLLVFHSALQRWLQPGGHIEPFDADPIAAARREVFEETGLARLELLCDGLFDVDVHDVDHGGVGHQHFDLRFLFALDEGVPAPGEGVSAVRWATLAELRALDAGPSLLRAAERALDPERGS